MAGESMTLYGIPGCDTVRKARRWLDEHDVGYAFHDFRKDGLDAARVEVWIDALDDWGALVNRRGTTWRRLDDAAKENLDRERVVALLVEHPTLVKRPVLTRGERVLVGFEKDLWTRLVLG